MVLFFFFFFFFLFFIFFFFFQAEDGIRDFCLSRGLGDVYKRQAHDASSGLTTLVRDFDRGMRRLEACGPVGARASGAGAGPVGIRRSGSSPPPAAKGTRPP